MGAMSPSFEAPKRRLTSSSGDVETFDDGDDVRWVYDVASPYLNNMRFLNESTVSDETIIHL